MQSQKETSEKSLDARARRAAKRAGFVASTSRRASSSRNFDGFRIVDPDYNRIEAGENYNLSAQEVIDFCAENRGTLAGRL